MCGIIAYLNFITTKKRGEIMKTLVNGLKRLEYRGYDSAGNNSLNVNIKFLNLKLKVSRSIRRLPKTWLLLRKLAKSHYWKKKLMTVGIYYSALYLCSINDFIRNERA
jgi:asparagine synthetase B (glutamine-hydrolysing)